MSHDEYKIVLLNYKCLRHSMNGIKGPGIGTLEKAFLSSIFFPGRTAFMSSILF